MKEVKGDDSALDHTATWNKHITALKKELDSREAEIKKLEEEERYKKEHPEEFVVEEEVHFRSSVIISSRQFDPNADPFADFTLTKITKTKFAPRADYDE